MIFAPGVRVRLNSGGPAMRVMGVIPGDQPSYRCQWFDDEGESHDDVFPEAVISLTAECQTKSGPATVLKLAEKSDNALHWSPNDLVEEAARICLNEKVERAVFIYETDDGQGVHYLIARLTRPGVLDLMKRAELTMYLEPRG